MATTNLSTLTGIPVVQPVISEWTSFTPTWTNVTMSGATGFYRREGDSMRIRVDGNPSGAGSAAIVTVTIPLSLNIDSAKMVSTIGNLNTVLGSGIFYDASTGYERPLFVTTNSATSLDFRTEGTERVLLGNELAVDDQLSWEALVPISEWAGQAYVAYGSGLATTTVPGLVGTGTQSFAGNKTFTGTAVIGPSSGLGGSTAGLTVRGGNLVGGSNLGDGAVVLGAGVTYGGVFQFSDISGTTLYIDSLYDSDSSKIQFRTKTATTPVDVGHVTGAGAWTFGPSTHTGTHVFRGSTLTLSRNTTLTNSQTNDIQVLDNGSDGSRMGVYKNASLANSAGFFATRNSSNTVYYLWQNGGTWYSDTTSTNIGTTSGTVVGSQTSDIRLKSNVESLPYGLAEILAINPIRFDKDGRKQIGFNAQQVRPIIPEVVYDTGEDIDGSHDKKLGMFYDSITAALVNAVKELKSENDALKSRIEILEAQ